jgi:hypothetical protein
MDLAGNILSRLFGLGLPISDHVKNLILPFLAVVLVQSLLSYLVERRFHENRYVQVGVALMAAFTATILTVLLLRSHVAMGCADVRAAASACSSGDVLVAFALFVLIWCAVFHLVAWHFGRSFSSTRFGNSWVKAIDYVYLTLSATGILRIVLGLVEPPSLSYATLAAPLILGIAIAIRMTKTTIEIQNWD